MLKISKHDMNPISNSTLKPRMKKFDIAANRETIIDKDSTIAHTFTAIRLDAF